jgi:hypothetical protein
VEFAPIQFKDISKRLGVFLARWFEVRDGLAPVLDQYFASSYTPMVYLSQYFLNAVTALEVFHRRRRPDTYMPQAQFDNVLRGLVRAIPSQVRKDHRSAMKGRMQYLNEHSLRKRLESLLREQHVLSALASEGPQAFVRKVADTRNYLTHHDDRLRKKAATGEDLLHLGNMLMTLLECCILEELRAGASLTRKFVDRAIMMRSLRRGGADQHPEAGSSP